MGEDGTRGSEHDKANLMTATTSTMPLRGSTDGGWFGGSGGEGDVWR